MRVTTKRFIRLVFLFSLATAWIFQSSDAQAQEDPTDLYLTGYMLVQDAEKFMKSKDFQKSYRKYEEAAKLFADMAQRYPNYEPKMRDYRRRKINEAIAALPPEVRGYGQRAQIPERVGSGSRPSGGAPGAAMLARKDQEIEYLKQERQDLGRQLAQKDRERIEALSGKADAERKMTSLLNQIAQMQEDLTQAQSSGGEEAAELKDDVARLQQELKQARESAADAEKLASHLQEELERASNYGQVLQTEREELERERERIRKLLSGSENEQIKTLLADNERLRNDLEEARAEAGKLRSENDGNKELIAKLRSKITTVEAELVKLQNENAAYREQVADLTSQLKDTDARLDAMSKSKGGTNEMLVKENGVLREIISKQLKGQSRRMQAKQMVVAELAKLELGSKEVLDLIDRMGQGTQLTQEEIETFSKSSGFNPMIIEQGTAAGDSPVDYPQISDNEGSKSGIGLNKELTQFAKAAAYDFFRGNFNRCESSYEQILQIAPDNVHSLRNLGIVKIRLRKFDEAQQVLEKALAYAPEDHYSHYVLGVLHYRLQDSDAAIRSMEKSLELNPRNARAHFYIAVICMEPGQGGVGRRNPSRAVEELKKVIALNPEYGDAHFNLAILYIEAPNPEILLARQHYREALRNGSQATPEMESRLGT